jgi:NAD(P)H dehydrogenase (quinone)
MGLLSWKMKRFWDEAMLEHWMKADGKIGCAFSSSGDGPLRGGDGARAA